MPLKRRRRWRRRIVWAAVAGLGIVLLGGVVALLLFQHIPAWYRPVHVSGEDLSRVRNSLPNTYQRLQAEAVKGSPFTFELSDRSVTEWVVARAELYPDAEEWLPPMLHDPVVVFQDDECILSARVEYEGWQTIAAVHLVGSVTNERVTVRVRRVTAGSLPIPLSALAKPLAELLNDPRLDVELMPDPLAEVVRSLRAAGPAALADEGVSFRNLFELKNAHRVVKVRGLSARDGILYIDLEPRR
jgi:hypothetical protein